MEWFTIIIGIVIALFGLTAFFGAPYVPSQSVYLRRVFDELKLVTETDVLVDIGAGDGVVLREASRRGARAVGYEINPILALIARWLSRRDEKVSVRLRNFWQVTVPDETTIVYAFSVKRDGQRLIEKMQQEATRLRRPLRLLCLGSPLQAVHLEATFEAYTLYQFYPIQKKPLTV